MKKFVFALALVALLTSCGGTTVKVKQSSDGVNAQVTVTTNNPTDVDVIPSVSVKLDDLAEFMNSVQDSLSFDENGEMILSGKDVQNLVKSYR